jgi:hypothetical protein
MAGWSSCAFKNWRALAPNFSKSAPTPKPGSSIVASSPREGVQKVGIDGYSFALFNQFDQ